MKLSALTHSPPFKLALYYALCFSLLCIALFWVGEIVLTNTIRVKQRKAVENKALEYRAWFQKGDTEQLNARMNEQSLQAGDILFVRVLGENMNYLNYTPNDTQAVPLSELAKLSPDAKGSEIMMGGEAWTLASVPIEGTDLTLQAGKNSKALETTRSDFRLKAMIIFIPGSLLALLTGTYLAYRFLSPTRKIIATMNDILESGDLSRRSLPDTTGNEFNAMVKLFNELLSRNEKLITVTHQSMDNIAHDLRTPLSRMKMSSERALTKKNPDKQSYKFALESCAEEVEYLEQLLNILMDVAEAESGAITLNKKPTSARKLLKGVTDLYEFVAEEKKITLHIECPEHLIVTVDSIRILQSLANLLDNSIKYSSASTDIYLKATAEKNVIRISIHDQGIGLMKKDIPHIWDRLYRADQSRTEKGMGLGLSLVKAIVEAHGGTVEVESAPEKGSIFSILFPLK